MAQNQKPTGRKPATKFAHLRKKMTQTKDRANVRKSTGRKGGNR